ncbi:MAG: translation elongation factor Ts [Pseudomonadota bacterium]
MAITATLVKTLRERTGAGMMECKKALTETDGDIEAAIENMRKSGQAKAAKKAGRIAADGVITQAISDDQQRGVLLEVNCETDFVAKDANFTSFAHTITQRALQTGVTDVEQLMALPLHDGEDTTVEETRQALVAKLGENLQVRRIAQHQASGSLAGYQHGVRIGVLVDYSGGETTLGKDLAMHVAASNPLCISEDQVPSSVLDKEREIATAQAESSGKPANIVGKMVEGRLRKYLAEITLLSQAFIKEPGTSVTKLLKQQQASVHSFTRFEVGEGIQKKTENFHDEVMAQAAAVNG